MNKQAYPQAGFTLVEMMIAVAIIGVLVTIGLPELRNFLLNNRLTSETNALVAALNSARAEAITRNREVNITALNSGGQTNEWGKGWAVWADNHPNCGANITDPPDKVITRDTEGKSCEELRHYEIVGNQLVIDGPDTLNTISQARTVDSLIRATTLTYRGDGTLAISAQSINFTASVRSGHYEKSRCLEVLRTGRVAMKYDDKPCQ